MRWKISSCAPTHLFFWFDLWICQRSVELLWEQRQHNTSQWKQCVNRSRVHLCVSAGGVMKTSTCGLTERGECAHWESLVLPVALQACLKLSLGWRVENNPASQCALSFLSRPFIPACTFRNFYWVWSFVTENVCILHVKAAPLSRLLHCEQHTHGNVSEGCCVSLDGLTSLLSQRRMTNAAWQTRCRIIFVGWYDDKRLLSSMKRTSLFFFPSVVSCPNGHVGIAAALSERS